MPRYSGKTYHRFEHDGPDAFDAAFTSSLNEMKTFMETFGCKYKCGSASGLRASAFAAFIAAAVSLFAH
jgi:hypothetical protein